MRKFFLALPIVLSVCFGWTVCALQFESYAIQKYALRHYGARGEKAVEAWLAVLNGQRSQVISRQLRHVNEFWNHTVLSSDDKIVWGLEDYWATPLETLGRQAGDCEDFVIGKYFSLIHLGVPAEKLRLIYVRASIAGAGRSQGFAHMVLGYYETPVSDPLVLDSLTDAIVPASQRKDLTPVFSFNAEGIYVGGAKSAPVDQITRWRRLLVRMQQEGFRW